MNSNQISPSIHNQQYSITNSPPHLLSTFNPTLTNIDYEQPLSAYLNQMNNKLSHSNSQQSENDEQNSNHLGHDQEVHFIINEVLNKRRKQSRLKHSKNSSHAQVSPNISIVNSRLENENEQLRKNIRKLAQKIGKLSHTKIGSSNVVELIKSKESEVQKLRQKLIKAQQNNTKMSLELSKLEQSRKSVIKSQQKQKVVQTDKRCSNCQNISKRTISEVYKISASNSPLKKDYYSPIMQFQEYSLNNEEIISDYEGKQFYRTSNFGESRQKGHKQSEIGIQVCSAMIQISDEERQLDDKIRALQKIMQQNNAEIEKYESYQMKNIM